MLFVAIAHVLGLCPPLRPVEHFTCVVKMLYNLQFIQALVSLSTKLRPEERQAWSSSGAIKKVKKIISLPHTLFVVVFFVFPVQSEALHFNPCKIFVYDLVLRRTKPLFPPISFMGFPQATVSIFIILNRVTAGESVALIGYLSLPN